MIKSKRYAIKKVIKLNDSISYYLYHKPWTIMWFLDPLIQRGECFESLEDAESRVRESDTWFDSVFTKRSERVA